MAWRAARDAWRTRVSAHGDDLRASHAATFRRPPVPLALLIIGLTTLVTVLDFNEPGEINVAVLYGLCVGLCAWSGSPEFLWSIAAVTIALTFAGLAFGPPPITGRSVLRLFWVDRALVAAKLVVLAGFVHLWIRRSERLCALSAQLRKTNQALSENLRQSQKLEAVGQLTTGIAHDFKNMLTVIIANLEIIAEGCEDATRRERLARSALRGAESATALVQRLLVYSRHPSAPPGPVHLDVIIKRLLSDWRLRIDSTIEPIVHLRDSLWPCRIDPAEFEATILNLMLNARDAMPDGGRLTIRAENTVLEEATIAGLSRGDYVLVSVSDNGAGISPASLAKVFDPFFTTKPPNRGSGLGLWMVRRFAEQAGGAALLDSTVGTGTRVRLYLPRAAP